MTLFGITVWSHTLNVLIILLGLLLILIVLIQRGKGGGLVGAFGGAGGSSPFGSRAGDTFTRITIGIAGVWVVAIVLQVWEVQRAGRSTSLESDNFQPAIPVGNP